MTILSASTEEREGFPPFLKPSECYETGMKELVRNHSLQLSPASKELVNLEAEENRIVFHFGLLLFDGDVERARELVKGECKLKEGGDVVPKSSSNASKSVDDVLKNAGDASEKNAVSVTAQSSDVSKEAIPSNETLKENVVLSNEMPKSDVTPSNETLNDAHPSSEPPQNTTPSNETLKRDGTAANETPKNQPPPSFAKTNGSPKGRKGVLLRFHPRIRDYFDWLLEDGLDRHVVETSMREEGIDPIVEVEWGHKE